MNTHADITDKDRAKSPVQDSTEKRSGAEANLQFVDNRPDAIAQRTLQEIVDNSPQAQRATQLQAMASQQTSTRQLQKSPAQENHTGMPDQLKSGIESLSGMDLSDVRVHNNSAKPAQLNALAYAQGNDIHLAAGQEQHLPHEAWHVVQQRQGRVKPTMQENGTAINDDKALENEADQMGQKAAQLKSDEKPHPADTFISATAHTPVQRQEETKNAGAELRALIEQLEQLQAAALELGADDKEAPDSSEFNNKLAKLKEIALGSNEQEKAAVLKTLQQEISNEELQEAKASQQPPAQKQPAQRVGGLILIGGAAIAIGIGALAYGIYRYVKKRKAKAIFAEFGHKHRRPDFDPDVVGEEHGGIRTIQGEAEGARPEDAPVVGEFRVKFHKLHSVKLYLEKTHPALYQQLDGQHNIRATLLRIAGDVKDESKRYKKRVKDMATQTPIATLKSDYEQRVKALGNEALHLAQQLQQAINAQTSDTKNLDQIHAAGTDIWRETWHRAVMAVNTVLHGRWPHWKGRLQAWTKQRRDEGLNYMDPAQIIGLDYIGSLAKGYKGPPKQAIRFTPEKFDVDANLTAPPLAAYALTVGNAIIDRGRIWSKHAHIQPIRDMEADIQQHLVNAGLIGMGMDPNEPFEAVIDAEGVERLVNAPGVAAGKKATSERDQQLRDRIFWARQKNMPAFTNIGAQLQHAGLATLDPDGHLILREHDEAHQAYAYTAHEMDQIEHILQANHV